MYKYELYNTDSTLNVIKEIQLIEHFKEVSTKCI